MPESDAPEPLGPLHRLGFLVPSSNSNAETSIARMLAGQYDIGAHFSRFGLPADLDRAIDLGVLGEAPALLAEVEPEAVAFHGTSGSWKGIEADRELSAELADVVGAPVTTASIAVVEALEALGRRRIGLVFPGPADIADQIVDEYRRHDIEVVRVGRPGVDMSNAQIAHLSAQDIEGFAMPAFGADVDAVVCVGTNMRSAYLAASWESRHELPVVDSATATLWALMRLAGIGRPVTGWGGLLAS